MRRAALGSSLALLVALAAATNGCAAPAPSKAAVVEAAPRSTPAETGLSALAGARYDEAEKNLRLALAVQPGPSAEQRDVLEAALVAVLRETGRYEDALTFGAKAAGPRARLGLAEVLVRQGKLDEALGRAREIDTAAPLVVRLEAARLRGEIFTELGRPADAKPEFLTLITAYNDGSLAGLPAAEKGEALGLVGRAAHVLRYPEDANDAFNEAEAAAKPSVRLLVWRGELLVEKFNLADAEEVATEALQRAPRHPDALVLLAEVRLGQALDLDGAFELAGRALDVNPAHARAHYVRAGTVLRDLDFAAAHREIDAGLAVNPRHLDLLSMRAAARFLAEDEAGFEAVLTQVDGLSPRYARIFDVVAEYAEWEHRYEDIEKLLRRGVRLDREDGRLRSNLGLTLVRSGSDAAGVIELRRAFELDPYDVRALNTLDLYEKWIPDGYEEVRTGPFRFRFPKAERALLERYLPPLLEDAHRQMLARYGFEPRAPLGMEIYATKKEFAVRTTGLPQAGIAGVCFGRKVATVSPRGAQGNLGMTLWHELSHVFHIGLSESRVPRWLTEGLAEWETARVDRGWSRELDLELFRALRDERLPEIGRFNRAFSHAESMNDIAIAYHASKRIADFIVATRGQETVVRLLAEFGKKRLPDDVLPEVLGASFADLDREFRAWLLAEFAGYDKQFVSRLPRAPLDELAARANAKGATHDDRVQYGLGLFRDSRIGEAEKILSAAIAERPSPLASFYLARAWLAQGQKDVAIGLVKNAIRSGADGYEMRMLLGRVFASAQNWKLAFPEAVAASEFDRTQADAWSLRATAAHQLGDLDGEITALRGWVDLSEHDGELHRRLLELLLGARRDDEAARVAERAIWAGLGDFATHRLTALAFAHAKQDVRARYERETATLLATSAEERAQLERDAADLALR